MLTVIIPNLNGAAKLKPLLRQLAAADVKVIISDGGSGDESLELAAKMGARLVGGCCGRGHQLRRGAWLADTDWLLFIHGDSQLSPDWYEKTLQHINTAPEKAGYFSMKFAAKGLAPRIVEGLVGLRSAVLRLPYGDQGLLISRRFYDEISGYAPMNLFEDVDIIRKIGRKKLVWVKASLITDASKYEREGYFKRGWRNIKLAWRYFKGENPDALYDEYT